MALGLFDKNTRMKGITVLESKLLIASAIPPALEASWK
jgi:hypothetical protein